MAGGRPLKYEGEETLRKGLEYIESCKDEPIVNDDGKLLYLNVNLPKIAGLAKKLDVRRETIHDWARKYPEFSHIVEKCLSEQEEVLVNKGLSGQYNPTIAKLLLTKHGYREGFDHTSDGDKIEGITFEIVNAPKNTDNTNTTEDSTEQ